MPKYKVRVYEGTAWSVLTQADHFSDYWFTSDESLQQIAERLNRQGFAIENRRKWIMPASILTVEIDE